MPYHICQWPDSVQRKEIEGLSLDAATAVLVMLRAMRTEGPWPQGYKIKPLKGHLHGLNQVNFKINKEQIRVVFFVCGQRIVVVSAFTKTSPQEEARAYRRALDRRRAAKIILKSDPDDIRSIH